MAISLNGQSFSNFRNVESEPEKVGVMHQALNGTRNWLHRADKGKWTITWRATDLATLDLVRAVFGLTGPFTYVHESGDSYTVLVDPGSFKITPRQGATLYYDIDLTVLQQ